MYAASKPVINVSRRVRNTDLLLALDTCALILYLYFCVKLLSVNCNQKKNPVISSIYYANN